MFAELVSPGMGIGPMGPPHCHEAGWSPVGSYCGPRGYEPVGAHCYSTGYNPTGGDCFFGFRGI